MNVLYIAEDGNSEPWFSDIARSLLGSQFELHRFDGSAPLQAQFADTSAVVDNGGHGTRAMIDAAASAGVGFWQALTTGLDHTDVDYIVGRGIRFAYTPGEFSAVALAEHALFLMLCLAKRLRESERSLAAGRMYEPVNEELAGSTLGLVGLGSSGRALARLGSAIGMRVIAIDAVRPERDEVEALGVAWFGQPDELLRLLSESDHVSLHVPLTPETWHMIGEPELAAMKSTAVLINVARGEIVDESALTKALAAGALAGAGLDVFSREPPDPLNPLLTMANVIATPHVAGVTRGTSRRRAIACTENLERFAAGLPLLHEITTG